MTSLRLAALLIASAGIGLLSSSQPSRAQSEPDAPAYSQQDVIRHFLRMGETRSICVGTEQDCAATAAAAPGKGFDLLVTFEHDSHRLTASARRRMRRSNSSTPAPASR